MTRSEGVRVWISCHGDQLVSQISFGLDERLVKGEGLEEPPGSSWFLLEQLSQVLDLPSHPTVTYLPENEAD